MNEQNIPMVLSVAQLAKMLCIGKNSAYDLVNSGQISSVRVGRQIRIPRIAVYQYLGIATA